MKKTRFINLAILVLAISLIFASCGASSNGMAMDKESFITEDHTYSASTSDKGNGSGYIDTETGVNVENDLASRKIIKNAQMTIQTKTFDTFMEELSKRINEFGGYVENSSIHGNAYTSEGNRNAEYVVRIPAENLEEFKNGVSALGNVTYYNESVKDVTTGYIDTESRIKALEAEHATLLELLSKSEDLESLLKVQQRLSDVNYELENYKSQLRAYDSLISYSTITINIREVERVTTVPSKQTVWQRIATDFGNNLKDIGAGFADFFVWFVASLPYLILVAIPTVVIIVLIRHKIKKNKKNRQVQIPPQS